MIRLLLSFFFLSFAGTATGYVEPSTTTLQCYLEVAGTELDPPRPTETFIAIDKPCGVHTRSPKIGSVGSVLSVDFIWIVDGGTENGYFFYLHKYPIKDGAIWSVSWNAGPEATHAHNFLGEDFKLYQLTSSGACLQNKKALICLHETGKTPERIKPFKIGWRKWVLDE